jgi:hypothetical protein
MQKPCNANTQITTRSAVGLLNASGGRVGGWHKPAVNNLTVKKHVIAPLMSTLVAILS